MLRLITLALLAAVLPACDSFDDARASSPSASASASAVAYAPRRDSDETRKLARAAADQGLAIAKTCVFLLSYYDNGFDDCTFTTTDAGKLSDAVTALSEHVKAHPEEAAPATTTFLVAAGSFVEWVQRTVALNRRRGTLALFQYFADAYNGTAPAAPIPVDPVDEMYRSPMRGFNKGTMDTSKRIVWRQCHDGACL